MIKRAFILAGGQGTRLRPVTLETPKPLVTVQGTPIATWLLKLFARHGVEDVTVIYPTAWKNKFEEWAVGARHASPVRINLFEEKEAMGTMGALAHEMDLGVEPIFVTNGDELKGLDLAQLADFHEARMSEDANHAATIALVRVPNPSEYGVAEMDGHRIMRFHEKPEIPPSTLISSGLYVINPAVLGEADKTKRFLMFEKDLFPGLAEQGRLSGCQLEGPWYDCGTMERWDKAIREWRGI
ncbi:nucleotidyltransferase family protein [Candidatus Uhrbacteria bacterium]|nr:nucleotidyltransferase family protein [Candidatus Uhrbacteria bacterium]